MRVNGHAFRMMWGPSTAEGSRAIQAVSNAITGPLSRYFFSAQVR